MKFRDFINSPLLEGGQAIKNSVKISQAEVREILPDLLVKIATTLNVSKTSVKLIGSAGKKPNDSDLSGDLDIAVELDPESVKSKLEELAGDNQSRVMQGINVYSFGYPVKNKIVQVDLMPVENIKFAEWSYQANSLDLEQGLKGAQRNELFFAVAKFMPQEIMSSDADGPIEYKRFFYDLSKGLMEGVKSRKGKKKTAKNFSTLDKKVITSDPNKIAKMMFGKHTTAESLSTFDGTLEAIRNPGFLYHDHVREILDLAKDGIKKKNLKIPQSL